MASKQLEILVTAKDAASAAFKQIGQSAGNIELGMQGAVKGTQSFSASMKSTFSLIKGLSKAYLIIEGATAALTLLGAGFQAYSKDVKKADEGTATYLETLTNLPLGLGKLTNSVGKALTWVTSGKATDMKKLAEDIRERQAEEKKWTEGHAGRLADLSNQQQEAEQQLAMSGVSEASKKRMQAQFELEKKIAAARKQWQESNKSIGADPAKLRNELNRQNALVEKWREQARQAQSEATEKAASEQAAKEAEAVKAEKEKTKKLTEAIRERAVKIKSTLAETQIATLKAEGRNYDASVIELKKQLDEKVAEVMKDESMGDSFQAGAMKSQMIAALNAQYKAQVAELAKNEQKTLRDKIEDGYRFELEQKQKLGVLGVQQELRRLDISKEYRKEIEAAQEIINDGGATAQQRQAAQMRLGSLQNLMNLRAVMGDAAQVQLPTGQSSRYLSGVAENYLQREQRKQTEQLTKLVENVDNLARWVQSNNMQVAVMQGK